MNNSSTNGEIESLDSIIDRSKIRILVVDDEAIVSRMISTFLELDNYNVTCFNESINIVEEIKRAKNSNTPYDLIIADHNMPDKTGIEIARELKFRKINIPTVLISNDELELPLSESLKLNISQFINKSNLNFKTLRRVVKNIIEPKFAQAQLLHSANLMNNLPVLIACMDENDNAHFFNDALINKLNYSRQELLDIPRITFQKIIHANQNNPRQENNYAEFHAINQDLEDKQVSEGREIKLYSKAGEHIWTFVKAKKYGAHTFFSFTDITERKDLEINIGEVLNVLLKTISNKDQYTSEHSSNVLNYTIEMCRALNLHVDIANSYSEGAILHDIGKIGIPGSILRKPSRLTDEEFEIIKTHPQKGVEIIQSLPKFKNALDGILYHHVHYEGNIRSDGSINPRSYPTCNLKREEIPQIGRIIGIADAYDAMTTNRAYRQGLGHEEAIKRLIKGKGTQFDPELVTLFADVIKNPRITTRFSIREFRERIN